MSYILTKLGGWEQRLDAFISENAQRKFDRAEWDCVRCVADCLFQMIGVDLAQELRDSYKSDEDAKQLIINLTDGGMHASADRIFISAGFTRIDRRMAHRGDPVYFESKRDPWAGCLAFCAGTHAYTPGDEGFHQYPMRLAKAAWHIPYINANNA